MTPSDLPSEVPRPQPTPLVELGVAEAYDLLLGLDPGTEEDLPPLDAIENEDWGRDWLLSRLAALPEATLARLNLSRDALWDRDDATPASG